MVKEDKDPPLVLDYIVGRKDVVLLRHVCIFPINELVLLEL